MAPLTRIARRARSDRSAGSVVIAAPQASGDPPVSRVWADVGGHPLWFESDRARLEPAPEAWASALLIPTMQRGLRLVSEVPLDPAWLENVERLQALLARWWGLPPLLPASAAGEPVPGRSGGRTALCFTGGVDSFYNGLFWPHPIEALVFVHGYNYRLKQGDRREGPERALRAAAEATGRRAVVVSTNLLDHPAYGRRRAVVGRVMGARLGAVGHVLGAEIDRLLVSSTWPDRLHVPNPVDPRLVELLSSTRVEVAPAGGELYRSDRLRAIAGRALALEHLSVCLTGPRGSNCSRCHKCVLTMAVLAGISRLERCPVLDEGGELAQRIDGLPPVDRRLTGVWQRTREWPGLSPDVDLAIERLVARSRRQSRRNRMVAPLAPVLPAADAARQGAGRLIKRGSRRARCLSGRAARGRRRLSKWVRRRRRRLVRMIRRRGRSLLRLARRLWRAALRRAGDRG